MTSNTLGRKTQWALASAPIIGMATAGLAAWGLRGDEPQVIPIAAVLAGIGITAAPGILLAASKTAGLIRMQRGILAKSGLFKTTFLGYMIANAVMFPTVLALRTWAGHETQPVETALALTVLPVCGTAAWLIFRNIRAERRKPTMQKEKQDG